MWPYLMSCTEGPWVARDASVSERKLLHPAVAGVGRLEVLSVPKVPCSSADRFGPCHVLGAPQVGAG